MPQYRLVVGSTHGLPSPSGADWFDSGVSVSATVASLADDDGAGTRYRCTGWTGTGSVPATGASTSVAFSMSSPSSITWNWMPQYRITFTESGLEAGRFITITVDGTPHLGTSPFGYSEWYDKDFSVAFSITALVDGADSGKRYALINWKNSAGSIVTSPQPISCPETFTAYYQTQHYLTVNTNPSGLSPQPDVSPSGSWYDIEALLTCTAQAVNGYDFDYWILDGVPQEAGNTELTVTMDKPHNATAHYTTTTDLNLNGIVDEADILMVASAFSSKRGEKDYNSRMDFDENSVIDIIDIAKVAKDFGNTT